MKTTADDDGPRLPIKLDATSNGEFAPVPLDAAARHARTLAEDALAANARRVGRTRRSYLVSLLGAAASLAAFNRAFAAAGKTGGRYALPAEAPFELAAAAEALAGDEFIFDVQLHHVNPQGAWRRRAGSNPFRNMPKAAACTLADPIECLSSGALLKDVFLDSDTAMGVLSHVPGGLDTNPLDFEAAGATRDAARALDGTERLLLHGRCMPTLAGELDGMEAQAARFRPAAFKTYTQFGPPGGPAGFFLDDDRHGKPFIDKARALGVRNIAVHKGLPFGPRGYEYSTARDIGPAARRHPDITFLVYHAGFDPRVKEGPYDPNAQAGVDVLVRSMLDAGRPDNVYAELGSTWRYLMRDPEQAAHLLGKLLKTFGEDRVLWGTDSLWYGSPQDQIQAFRAFQIGADLQEKHGYPALTPVLKRKVFGLNAARVYGLDAGALRGRLGKDGVQKRKSEYLNDPRPSFATYGPRNRAEFLALRRMQGGMP
jgi:predicted TIM-barrel fold metal-dependent hydrolase